MNKIMGLIPVFCLVFSACQPKADYSTYIREKLEISHPQYYEDYDSIFIIPRVGCNSCKNDADKAVRKRLDKFRNLYIFTNINSKKLLIIEYGKETLGQTNVYVDSENNFYKPSFSESGYPTLLTVNADGSLKFHYLLDEIY